MGRGEVQILQSSLFSRAYKKLHKKQKAEVDEVIELIKRDPYGGELKKGDLSGVYVYKFKLSNHLTLIAYEFDPKTRMLLLLGSYENFYQKLKRS